MNSTTYRICFALGLIVAFAGANAHRGTPTPATAELVHCQVLLESDVDIPAKESGLLVVVAADDGQEVEEGTPLAQLDDWQSQLDKVAAELERDAAKARAADDIEVQYAIKSAELAEAELTQSLEINRRSPGAVPTSELRRLQLAKHRAELQIQRSRLDLQVAQMNADVQDSAVQAAEEAVLRRHIVAPFDATILEVFRRANEWVNAGEPVLRLVRLDQLRVDGFLSGEKFDSGEIADQAVTVSVNLARGQQAQFQGRVVFVSPLIQHGNRFRVRAIVSNEKRNGHWLLRPGMEATMVVHLQ